MGAEQRQEFERRLLALVRHQLDYMDEDYPHGYEIDDFVITWRFHVAPEPGSTLQPWFGGPFPGWEMDGYTTGSSTSYIVDEELLLAALDAIRSRREAAAEGENSDDG